MNQSQAITKLRAAIGKNFAYRVDNKAPIAEQREQARDVWKRAKAAAESAATARDARRAELLSDPVYLRLASEAKAATEFADKARGHANRRRITVGRDGGWCFSVEADGDTWADVVAKVCEKQAA